MNDPGKSKDRASLEDVIRGLKDRRPAFEDFCRKVRDHIEECLRDEETPFQSIQWRVKSEDKVRSKYTSKSDKYFALDDITDIAGLRVITYYEDDVDKVKEIIERQFAIDIENCEDKRLPENPETFTYHALHLVVSLKRETLGDRAFKQFSRLRGEIQITSILRHAWAEIEHGWYDRKDRFPRTVKRRFARLSALIDLADEQFVELRDEWEQTKESVDRGLEVGFADIPIDVQSLRAFIEREPLVLEIDAEIADANSYLIGPSPNGATIVKINELLGATKIGTIGELKDKLTALRPAIREYAEFTLDQRRTRGTYSPKGHFLGECVFSLAMMIFLDKELAENKNASEASRRESLYKSLHFLGFATDSILNTYEDQALPAQRILAKYSR